jgi:hypothetical protein
MLDELVVSAATEPGSALHSIRHDAFPRARQESKKGGPIVARKIDAIIKFLSGNGKKIAGVAEIASHDQSLIDSYDGWD